MKSDSINQPNLLFKLAVKFLRFFLFTILGFAIAYIMAHVSGAGFIAKLLFSPIILLWFLRIAVLIFCLFAIAVIVESWT